MMPIQVIEVNSMRGLVEQGIAILVHREYKTP